MKIQNIFLIGVCAVVLVGYLIGVVIPNLISSNSDGAFFGGIVLIATIVYALLEFLVWLLGKRKNR